MFYQFIKIIAATKIFIWIKPRIRTIFYFLIFVGIVIYLHNEYLIWAEKSNNLEYLGISFIIKNILVLLAIIFFVFYLKRPTTFETDSELNDGFDKFRKKEKLRSKLDNLIDKK